MESVRDEGREKYWSELTQEEKVERLRKEFKNLLGRLEIMDKVLEDVQHHIHKPDGLPVVQRILGAYGYLYPMVWPLGGVPPNDDVYI